MRNQLATATRVSPLFTSPALLAIVTWLSLPACQGSETTASQHESLVCSGADAPVYRNRFAPQLGASGVATAPEAAAGIISSDAPAGGGAIAAPATSAGSAPIAAGSGTSAGAASPIADPSAPPISQGDGSGDDAGGAGITAMVATCGPSPCAAGQVAVEAPPVPAATPAVAGTSATIAGPAIGLSTGAPVADPTAGAPALAPSPSPSPSPTTTLVCAPPPPSCPQGQSPQFTMKQTWECTDCSLVVTYGFLYGNYRRCVNMPDIQCPVGEVPTWVFEHEQWECKSTCDNGQYDQHLAQGLLVCVPC
jgi:hypothetical protein